MHAGGRSLEAVLLHGTSGDHAAEFDQVQWEFRPGSEAVTFESVLVGQHELLHAKLNISTAYGNILTMIRELAREGGDELLARLGTFVQHARKAHEVYATFMSAVGLSLGDVAAARATVEPHAEYRRYFEIALAASGAPHNAYFRVPAVAAVVRFAMQGRSFIERALDGGLERLTPAMVRAREYPDARLKRALAVAGEPLWKRAFAAVRAERSDLPGWDAFESTSVTAALSATVEFKDTEMAISVAFYDALVEAMGDSDALAFNGHFEYSERLIAEWNRAAGSDSAVKFRSGASLDVREHDRRLYVRERLQILDVKQPARIVSMVAAAPPEWMPALAATLEHDRFIFVVIRTKNTLEAKYQLDAASRAILEQAEDAPLMLVRGAPGFDDGEMVEHLLLPDSRSIISLWNHIGLDYDVVVNVSLRAFRAQRTTIELLLRIRGLHGVSMLLDDLPYEALPELAQGGRIGYVEAVMDTGARKLYALVLVLASTPATPIVVPCSFGAGMMLIQDLQLELGDRVYELDSLEPHANEIVGITMRHLLREEPYFGFMAD